VIVNEPGLEEVPLPRGYAGVKRRQLPQRHNLVAHACARVLASLGVAVHIVLALSRLLEGNLQTGLLGILGWDVKGVVKNH
jgi:hypothetical protein